MQANQQLLIRADASPQIGTGHVMRCLALAQAWLLAGGAVTFLMGTAAPALELRLQQEGIEIVHLPVPSGTKDDADQTINNAHLREVSWIVIDGYHFGSDYQRAIKKAGYRLLVIDDYSHAEYYWADLVLNQNIYASEALYPHREDYTQLLLGTKYVLLRKEFWPWRGWQRQISPVAYKVLVTMGGSDPGNMTSTVIHTLQKMAIPDLEAIAIIGGNNPYHQVLTKLAQAGATKIELRQNVTNMPELMAWADMAVTAGGSTCWELAFMGLPSLAVSVEGNQVAILRALNTSGIVFNLGRQNSLSAEDLKISIEHTLGSEKIRRSMLESSRKLVDGYGSSRTAKALLSKAN